MPKNNTMFSAIKIEGGLFSQDLLQNFITDSSQEGLNPESFHLKPRERLNEAANRAYSNLIGYWTNFQESIKKLPEEAIGTTETRERWLLPLFQELGYGRLQPQKSVEIEGKLYPISHQANEPVAVHLVSYKWSLDKRNPYGKTETRLSPHSLMQEFLNRSENFLWGFLSNGYQFRILRDNVSFSRISYIEFDLQTIMEHDLYDEFFIFWILCHQSRVEVKTAEDGSPLPESCWLEKWYNISYNDGVRIRDNLRDNVKAAIEGLGTGFLAHPNNATLKNNLQSGSLSVENFYHQLLIMVYRLLFLFVAEERNLLLAEDIPEEKRKIYYDYYSSTRIRNLALHKYGTHHPDLWIQLKLVFNYLYSGNEVLGLPALGSFLFNPESTVDLNDCDLSNKDVLSIFRNFCYTTKNKVLEMVSFRNMGSEELGSVYESFLEMHPEINLDAPSFNLDIVIGSERKTTGSFYTPPSLVNSLLDTALNPVIDKTLSSNKDNPEETLLSLKICDPACGSGHFLIAAAHRLAKRLATVRTGEEEPSPEKVRIALRDVIGNCIYGVDINPLAVELCKISLWMESLQPGKTLNFLDHHIQCGNSILGCTTEELRTGIPDVAFTPLSGDDPQYCTYLKKRNKEEREAGIIDFINLEQIMFEPISDFANQFREVDKIEDDNLNGQLKKEESYKSLKESQEYKHIELIFNAWCAAFAWKKVKDENLPPLTHSAFEAIIEYPPEKINPAIVEEINRLAKEYKFFHWHLAFPYVFEKDSKNLKFNFNQLIQDAQNNKEDGIKGDLTEFLIDNEDDKNLRSGFDCVLENPPWEKIKLQEKEFFAKKDEDITNALNASIRKKYIEDLVTKEPLLYQTFLKEKRKSEVTSLIIRESKMFPLCGKGDVNTYAIFAELNLKLLNEKGRCGCLVPSGIATDFTTKDFFQCLIEKEALISLYDFENKLGIFNEIDSRNRFCLLTFNSIESKEHNTADFVFFAHSDSDLKNIEKHFKLTSEEIRMLNPNTLTCPVFPSKKDAELAKLIYKKIPVLINVGSKEIGNPWKISLFRMFDMSNDSHLFKTKKQLEQLDFIMKGNHYYYETEYYLPLYEAKMIHQFNHRFGDFEDLPSNSKSTNLPEIPIAKLQNPFYEPMPRYWVPRQEVEKIINSNLSFLLGFRNVTNTTNERTFISTIIPYAAVGNSMPLFLTNITAVDACKFISCLNSYIFDYIARLKVGGINLNFYLVQQLPVLPPSTYETEEFSLIGNSLINSVLELVYTSYSLKPFAKDCGYDGPPFIWDAERRFEIRCELDALYFHLYLGNKEEWITSNQKPQLGFSLDYISPLLKYFPTPRNAVEYVLDTFPIVKKNEEKKFGESRTKRRILEIYDEMTECLNRHIKYQSPLNNPPGPPCDSQGNFIPFNDWNRENYPSHIHPPQ